MDEFKETLFPHWGQFFSVEELLFEQRTEHQHLVIFRNEAFGRVLALDGVIQTTEEDEFIYHEMLAHVPIFAHGAVRQVLIVGGGDGGMLREVLRHSEVASVTQVEIDQSVIDLCQEYLPQHSAGAFDDPRVQVVIADGARYVHECEERFDLVIIDSTDPIGPGEALFRQDFYAGCRRCLNAGGVLVTQNGNIFGQLEEICDSQRRLGPLFQDVRFYCTAVPTYVGGVMAFGWATDDGALSAAPQALLEERFRACGFETRYYSPRVHGAAFALPRYVEAAIEAAAGV